MPQNIKKQLNNNFAKRPPIVVVMGHVDHGKTSILDYIRKTRVAKKEAGGITQHIGAYEIETTHEGAARKITFIDTPGHEAFAKMRSRGARVADIAILVVASDEGFKPQTKEALAAIKSEKMPFIIAANKIDKPNANIEKIKKECGENEIYIEEWGGEVPFVPLSAERGDGVDDLLINIILLADLHEYGANLNETASGVVIESHLDKRRGNTATLIIKNGTLKKKMFVCAERCFTPVKIFENFLGEAANEASFSSPALLAGFDCLPSAGDGFVSFNSRQEAEKYLSSYSEKQFQKSIKTGGEDKKTEIFKINLSLNADTNGSLEALRDEILKLENENVKINILNQKAGNITEDDIKFASASPNAIILGFNVEPEKTALNVAERTHVVVKTFDIIYKLKDWLKEEIENRAPIRVEEELLGKARILKIFKCERDRQILGGRVVEGKIIKGGYFRIARKNPAAIFSEKTETEKPPAQGKIIELEKNKVKSIEAGEGSEFGIMVETKKEIKEGDTLEIYERKTLKKKIYE